MSAKSEPAVPAHARIAFIGGGNMARSLIGAQLARGVPPAAITVAEPRAEARGALAREFAVPTFSDNPAAVAGADCVVLAVKPQVMRAVCTALAGPLRGANPLVISIAAGVRIAQIERLLGDTHAIVRCMPNTPALVGAGAAGLCANRHVDAGQRALAERLLDAAGIVRWIDDEAQMDTVTALSGSGPAYFFLLVEAMEDAAVQLGLPRDTARALAAQTCLGAGHMLADGTETATELRKRVTSPHGTTAAALDTFEQGGFRALVERALDAAKRRGAEMSAEMDTKQ
ncbi:MAG: pyrroline-5-carboxylate reductase [Xanthomonadaceae bacterium]|nr:pyrroline-5-carboxylate reductase [Xanthomonadaceae bacterium]MDE2054522.1 pyrroline-5-carboxylate reductase [Xanthomonadaceae bacterium]